MTKRTMELSETKKLLEALEDQQCEYVIWKGKNEAASAILGDGDLDLHVKRSSYHAFLRTCTANNWLVVESRLVRNPNILHFYKYGTEGTLFHLHVYFRIDTGHSWLKEYSLPVSDFLFDNRKYDESLGAWVLNDKSQAYVFLLRHMLKSKGVLSRLLLKKSQAEYQLEWESLGIELNELRDFGPFSLNQHLEASGLKGGFKPTSWWHAKCFASSMVGFKTKTNWLGYLTFSQLVQRTAGKLLGLKFKYIQPTAAVIAITGVDGSGKSTLSTILEKDFSKFLTVKRASLGRTWLQELGIALRSFLPQKTTKSKTETKSDSLRSTNGLKAVFFVLVALERRRIARACQKASRKGVLVITDRWPSKKTGIMDGPKIVIGSSPSGYLKLLHKIEQKTYRTILPCDLCFWLDVNVATALQRNSDRLKPGKESDEEIQQRYDHNQEYVPISDKKVLIENRSGPEEAAKNIKAAIIQYLTD